MKLPAAKDLIFVAIQLILFVFYFTPMIDFHFSISLMMKNISLVFAWIGLAIILIALLQLNKNLTPFPTPKSNSNLIKVGLYKYARHPIYSGIILSTIFFGCYHQSVWKIAIGFLLFFLFLFKSKYEEGMLAKKFFDYADYQRQTFRFFPFL